MSHSRNAAAIYRGTIGAGRRTVTAALAEAWLSHRLLREYPIHVVEGDYVVDLADQGRVELQFDGCDGATTVAATFVATTPRTRLGRRRSPSILPSVTETVESAIGAMQRAGATCSPPVTTH